MKIKLISKKCRVFLFFTLFVALSSFSLRAQQVKLNLKDVPLSVALKEITNQTGYNFVYSDRIINPEKPISFVYEADVEPIDNLLKKLFADIGIQYQVSGKQVALSESVEAKTTIRRPCAAALSARSFPAS